MTKEEKALEYNWICKERGDCNYPDDIIINAYESGYESGYNDSLIVKSESSNEKNINSLTFNDIYDILPHMIIGDDMEPYELTIKKCGIYYRGENKDYIGFVFPISQGKSNELINAGIKMINWCKKNEFI